VGWELEGSFGYVETSLNIEPDVKYCYILNSEHSKSTLGTDLGVFVSDLD
jgi:hypothetical protein